jgi:hypothetical protein
VTARHPQIQVKEQAVADLTEIKIPAVLQRQSLNPTQLKQLLQCRF